jgi:hypothetical protein
MQQESTYSSLSMEEQTKAKPVSNIAGVDKWLIFAPPMVHHCQLHLLQRHHPLAIL